MDEDVRSQFLKTELKQFEDMFKNNFPDMKSMDWKEINSIEQFVQNSLGGAFSRMGTDKKKENHFPSEVFETHDRIIAKINIPQHIKLDNIRVYVNGSNIKLEEINEGLNQLIKLPASINEKSAKALFRDGILQIQSKKQFTKSDYHEVFIRSQ
jgi:HSP20 family molecular chaperone IbpA